MWSAIAALQQAVDNLSSKELNEKFKFLPVLSRLLVEVSGRYKILKVLSILQKLTYNIDLAWNEVYLRNFVNGLMKHLFCDEEEITHLSASVLINLCFKNASAAFLVLKERDLDQIILQLKKHRILRFKMQYILKDSRKWSFNLEIAVFMQNVVEEIEKSIMNWDSDLIQHVVDFFADIQLNHPQYLQNYFKFNEIIEDLMNVRKYLIFLN